MMSQGATKSSQPDDRPIKDLEEKGCSIGPELIKLRFANLEPKQAKVRIQLVKGETHRIHTTHSTDFTTKALTEPTTFIKHRPYGWGD